MALSITELELQSTEFLPAREVMTTFGANADTDQEIDGGWHGHTVDGSDGNTYAGGLLNGINVQDVLTDIDVEEIQVGLVNVMVEDIQDTLDLGTANNDENAIVED
jgi:hypothetical protein